jgi:large subunit ribosomal protein L18
MKKHTKSGDKAALKARRKSRIRKKVSGTAERPRLSVFRSARHVYAQVIDDITGRTLVAASSFERDAQKTSANVVACAEIGKVLAQRCIDKKITMVVFDKNGNKYHGRIKALADGAREGGLAF